MPAIVLGAKDTVSGEKVCMNILIRCKTIIECYMMVATGQI